MRAKDLDENAILRFRLDANQCEAKTDRGTLLTPDLFNCEKYFKLGETDGVVTTNKILDRELFEVVVLGVIVEDVAAENGLQIDSGIHTIFAPNLKSNHEFLAKLLLIIDDVNDNNPKFRRPYYRFSVTENSKNGIIIGTVTADDSDKNKTITYALDGPSDMLKLFYLDANSGDIVVSNKIDFETFNWINLTVSTIFSFLICY